ncbi:unnamed protein product [Ambrosiozyma monospora]|uniref:Unnamed protein product n=1 Tax=Ambrosiozyma monospora TaxID=43982 RepID=A0A9W6YY68_AMBMO|nr:unnamed protein product [Ambrosiozyma monospora]
MVETPIRSTSMEHNSSSESNSIQSFVPGVKEQPHDQIQRHETNTSHFSHVSSNHMLERHYTQQSAIEDELLIHLVPDPTFDEISKGRKIMLVISMALTQLLSQAVMSQTVVPSNFIAKDFGVANDAGEISWMTAAYSLSMGTFILISGRFGDLLGYKLVYVSSYIVLSLFSLLAGISYYSGSIEFFDICRAFQGLAFSASVPNALGILGHYFPDGPEKNMAFAVFAGVAPGGFVIGALFDALFAQLTTWRWIFYVTCIVSLCVSFTSFMVIPGKIGSRPKKLEFAMFDPWGSVTSVTGLVLVNFALNHGPVVGWDTVYVYVLLIVGVLFLVLCYFIERNVRFPLVPPLNTEVLFTLGCISLGWSSFGIWLFYTFKFAYEILHLTIAVAAVQFIPAAFSGMCAGITTAKILPHVPTSLVMLGSLCCFEGGILLSGLRPRGQVYWAQKFPSMIIAACGMDSSFPSGIMILSNALPQRHQGLAASLVNVVVNYSISIGLGIAGTVEYYTAKHGHSPFEVIRDAFYTGMGLSGCGVLLALIFCSYQFYRSRHQKNVFNEVA